LGCRKRKTHFTAKENPCSQISFGPYFLKDFNKTDVAIVHSKTLLKSKIKKASVADPNPDPNPDLDPPDPHVFGPPGSGSTNQRYGSFYHHAKIVRKTLIPTIL
jgi:hypothetical protein